MPDTYKSPRELAKYIDVTYLGLNDDSIQWGMSKDLARNQIAMLDEVMDEVMEQAKNAPVQLKIMGSVDPIAFCMAFMRAELKKDIDNG